MRHVILFAGYVALAVLTWFQPVTHKSMCWFAFDIWAAYVNIKAVADNGDQN